MCLAIPMTVKSIEGTRALAEAYGVEKYVDIAMTPDVVVGDKVIIHAGFVIEKLDPESAREIEAAWDEYHRVMNDDGAAGRRNGA
ncbi:MAG: HypC/HybG/HupF family hydrogenase formation chaperone [Spirochaetes bacterium]|nr:HypC/HybG/HupF family hydrogenase formation chaperone [Spirochaetota bacterium]